MTKEARERMLNPEITCPETSKLADVPPAGGSDSEEQMEAELNTVMLEQNVSGLETAEQITETCQALDNLAPWEVTRYVEKFATLLKHASPGPWRQGIPNDSVVNDRVEDCSGDTPKHYGGNPIFESARLADRELIVFMRNIAPSILHDIHYAQTLDSINDGLLKACGQLLAENKALLERIKSLMDQRIQVDP